MSSRTIAPFVVLSLALAAPAALAEEWPLVEAHHPLDGPALSPEGGRIAYATSSGLWVRDRSGGQPAALETTQGASFPFWSPEGDRLGYVVAGEAGLSVMSVSPTDDAPPRSLGSLEGAVSRGGLLAGALWREDDSVLVGLGGRGLLTLRGGSVALEAPNEAKGEQGLYCPASLPGGGLLLSVRHTEGWRLVLREGGRERILYETGDGVLAWPAYSPPGHVLFTRMRSGNELWALPVSPSALEPTGPPVLVAAPAYRATVAHDGSVAFRSGPGGDVGRLVWVGREGRVLGEVGRPRYRMRHPLLSPDAKKVAFFAREPETQLTDADVWTLEIETGVEHRLTGAPQLDFDMAWHPSGQRLVVTSYRWGTPDLYEVPTGGFARPGKALLRTPLEEWEPQLSPDGSLLVYYSIDRRHPERSRDIWLAGVEPRSEPRLVLGTEHDEHLPRISPDGRLLAYVSNATGRPEVYVRSFPSCENERRVSIEGGLYPRWRGDSRELFFVEGDRLMAASVEAGKPEGVATPRPLFDGASVDIRLSGFDANNPTYDVAPDGERFIVLQTVVANQSTITVLSDWTPPAPPRSLPTSSPSRQARFRGDLAGSGVYDTPAPRRLVGPRWAFETAGPVRSSPAAVEGTVFVGSGDGRLYAIDSETGRERWHHQTDGAVHSSPAVVDGVVYATSRDEHLYAVDAASGQLRWRFALGNDLPFRWGWDYLLSSPAVADGVCYVGSGDGHLYAVDARSGRRLWAFPTGERVRSSPVVADGVVYFAGMDGVAYALRAEDGEEIWRHETEGAGLDSSAFGFDRTSITSSPALTPDLVVFGSRDGHLYGVDRATGQHVWRHDHHLSWVVSSPAVRGGMAFVGSSDGQFFGAVRLDSGEELWRYLTPARVFSSGAVAGDRVVVGCDSGHVFALDTETGAESWRFRASGQVISSPVVAGGSVYFGSDDGKLYALAVTPAGGAASRRAVYWDASPGMRWFSGGEPVRDFLSAEGYEVLDAALLPGFLQSRLDDAAASVVVFAVDQLPEAVLGSESEPGLLKRYLAAGGRVVWLGAPPDILDRDPETGRPVGLDPSRPARLLGVDHASISWDHLGAQATAAGREWGLPSWWVGSLGVDAAQVTTVLGRDEYGRAVAWIKSFGGPEGSGFIRLWGRADPIEDVAWIQDVAEHGLDQ